MRNRYALAAVAAVVALTAATAAFATPNINGVFIKTRVFNDCQFSALTVVNNYPAQIIFDDSDTGCNGFANLHTWSFSADGGATDAVFNNNSAYKFDATVLTSGVSGGEGGLRVSPWWSKYADGKFMLNAISGEVACFSGRLPFYQFFPGNTPGNYQKGTPCYMAVTYLPRALNSSFPAVIEYRIIYNGNAYSSGLLPFDQGNPAEDPPYGQWGMLNDGRVGGYAQPIFGPTLPIDEQFRVEFSDVKFENLDTVPTTATSWGKVKGLYR